MPPAVNLMQPAWDTGQLGRLRTLLAETEAYPDRGFEWYYWQRLCHLDQHTFIGHRSEVRSVSWSPDGTRLATGSTDGTAKVWDAAGGRELLTPQGACERGPFRVLVAGRDAAGDGERRMARRRCGTRPAAASCSPSRAIPAAVCSVSWSPDGTRLATGSADETAKVWDAAGGRELLTLKGHTGRGLVRGLVAGRDAAGDSES